MHAPEDTDSWLLLTDAPLPVGDMYAWSVLPRCGAVVLFSGTVRDHADGRDGVSHLEYEAYEEQVVGVFADIEAEIRRRWPDTGRVVIAHRVGRMELEESSVVVAVSSPHRPEAFEAARYGIDAVKASAPIWKHETWADGSDWGTGAHDIVDPAAVRSQR